MKAIENPPQNLMTTPIKFEVRNQVRLAQSNDATMDAAKMAHIGAVLQEYLESPASKEELRKSRAENIKRLLVLVADATQVQSFSLEEAREILSTLHYQDEKVFNQMLTFDLGQLKGDDFSFLKTTETIESLKEILQSELPQDIALDKEKYEDDEYKFLDEKQKSRMPDSLSRLNTIVPDSEIFDKVLDVIQNMDETYVIPYQKIAEIAAELYGEFSNINTALSEMITGGQVNNEDGTISFDVAKLGVALNALQKAFYDPSSSIVQTLASIQFSVANKAKAEEMIQGTGLVLAGGPPAENYYLAVDRAPFESLMTAFKGMAPGYPTTTSVSMTTYQLQSFQVAFSSVGEQLASEMQTATEKFKRATSVSDNFLKLVSAATQTTTDANKGFLQ